MISINCRNVLLSKSKESNDFCQNKFVWFTIYQLHYFCTFLLKVKNPMLYVCLSACTLRSSEGLGQNIFWGEGVGQLGGKSTSPNFICDGIPFFYIGALLT